MADVKIDQLIIVGNGFDKSIGFPTSYREFLIFLLKEEFDRIAEITTIRRNDISYMHNYDDNLLFKFYIKGNTTTTEKFKDFINIELIEKKDFDSFKNHQSIFFNFKSNFINALFNFKDENWGDIETIYYQYLLEEKNAKVFDLEKVNLINSQLDYIKKQLIFYLSSFEVNQVGVTLFGSNKFSEILKKRIKTELINPSNPKGNVKVIDRYFINFNYTDFLQKVFLKSSFKNNSEIIPIHGNIEDNLNHDQTNKDNLDNIIFGYGDEDNKDFDSLKNAGEDSLLKNIKTYNYQNNDNYKRLLGVLSKSRDFQVIIYGHSCSLSDRVLLREIFENDKCRSIRVLHHSGIDSYYRTIYNISRIFKENRNVREKVEFFDASDEIPQVVLLNK
jgi:hypothetical protein